MFAWQLAGPGKPNSLNDAIAACDKALERKPSITTETAWASLKVTRDLLCGRLARLTDRKAIGKEGQPIAIRRHHPGDKAHRIRPLRFEVMPRADEP